MGSLFQQQRIEALKVSLADDLPILTQDRFVRLLLENIPMLDVRAEVEFEKGAFPSSDNIPLLNNQEREAVGTRYKDAGQDAAVALAADLITEEEKQQRQKQWAHYIEKYPTAILYCFRGGMRSRITQQWIYEATGKKIPRVEGGYKALRTFLLESIERLTKQFTFVVLSGRTGSGKTRLLKQFANSIDLEGLANHRGSAFGPRALPQPTQINFENALAIELLRHEALGHDVIIVEDEGRNIGSTGLPLSLVDAMKSSNIVKLDIDDKQRNEISVREYITEMLDDFVAQYDSIPQAKQALGDYLLQSLGKIKKRLGGERYQRLDTTLRDAIQLYQQEDSLQGFVPIVQELLTDYYDPMYDYQLQQKQTRIVYSGDWDAVAAYLGKHLS